MRKNWLFFILLVVLNCVLSACSPGESDTLYGYLEGELTYLSSPVAGYLDDLPVERGQQIVAGQSLFRLNTQPEKADLIRAEAQYDAAEARLADLIQGQRKTVVESIVAQLEQAEAQANLASLTLNRTKKLYRKEVVAKAALDMAEEEYDLALKRIAELRANLAEANLGARQQQIHAQRATIKAEKAVVEKQRWLYEQKDFKAKNSAVVFDTFYHIGEYVPATRPVLAMLSRDNIKLIFYIPEPKLSDIKLGDLVTFNCDSCETNNNQAEVEFISNLAEFTPPIIYSSKSRQKLVFRVEAKLQARELQKLKAGQPVSITLHSKK